MRAWTYNNRAHDSKMTRRMGPRLRGDDGGEAFALSLSPFAGEGGE